MKIILLGGNSKKNRTWVHNVSNELKRTHQDIAVFEYLHWEALDDQIINLNEELNRVEKTFEAARDYVILAKSAGVLLALKGIKEKKLFPKACIFLGTAILWGRENDFTVDDWLKDYKTPTLYIQKKGDPAIHANDLDKLLKKLNTKNYKLLSIFGAEHEYSDFQDIALATKSFIDELG